MKSSDISPGTKRITSPVIAVRETIAVSAHSLDNRSRYFSRELSWLAFNRRVLEEAEDIRNPIIERAKFLAIVSSNLDEFVMVRLAEVHALAHQRSVGGIELPETGNAPELLDDLRRAINSLVADQYRCWRDELRPRLAQEGFVLVPSAQWGTDDQVTLRAYFRNQLEPVLTPLGVDPTKPFPLVANRGLTVAVRLEPLETTTDARPGERTALVGVPSGNRLISLIEGVGRYALAEDVVTAHLDLIFPGYRILGRCLFRVTRDGALEIDENRASDLLSEIEQELSNRDHSNAVRLEVAADGDPSLRAWLQKAMRLDVSDLYAIDGPLDLTVLFGVGDRLNNPALRDKPLPVTICPSQWSDPFATIRAGELLLHHPYQSYQRVVELVERAAEDPRVLAIKQTLYRVSATSPIMRALMRAARAGKQVTLLIELKARFDEATNIRWARALEEAGAHVVYGLVGLKVHAKLLMIIRREEDGICRYCHIGTGNYNDRTAKLYTDLSYITANEAVGRDVAALFNMLTGYSQPPEWERLLVAPLNMRNRFVELIRRETEHAKAVSSKRKTGGRIIAKFNSLVDQGICDELYAASQAGVQIDLIVRGMCILRPGVPGLSDNIRVRSIVGRLLEHSRIYHFDNDGKPVTFIGSADWMSRNLDRRVECMVRIEQPELHQRLMLILDCCLADTVQARELLPDGSYRRIRPAKGQTPRSSLDELLAEGTSVEPVISEADRVAQGFKPRRKNPTA
jgi:polyphosphate kinase